MYTYYYYKNLKVLNNLKLNSSYLFNLFVTILPFQIVSQLILLIVDMNLDHF